MVRLKTLDATAKLAAALTVLTLGSCVTAPDWYGFPGSGAADGTRASGVVFASTSTVPSPAASRSRAANERQRLIVEGAMSLLGAKRLVVRGSEFPMDCSGFVRAAYHHAGIDLTAEFHRFTGNGVARIYKTLEARGLLSQTHRPAPGDIIFWDNTYDRNKDGKWNDPLTHTGIVVRSYDDGAIEYAHVNYRTGVVIEHMNLVRPNVHTERRGGRTVIVNSPMRMKGQVTRPEWLSGQLVNAFGRAYLLEL